MHERGLKPGKACIDSQVWARNQESLQPKGQSMGNSCSDSQIDPLKSRITAENIFSTNHQHVPSAHPMHIPQHAFHHALTTRLALDVLHGGGLDSGTKQFDSGSIAVRQWRQMRVLMRPEAAFPYVFAAEGAQHPPIGRHAQRSPPNNSRPTIATQQPATQQPAATKESLSKKVRSSV